MRIRAPLIDTDSVVSSLCVSIMMYRFARKTAFMLYISQTSVGKSTRLMAAQKTRFTKREARERWKHEDLQINHRLNWLGLSQFLLFSFYYFTLLAGGRSLLKFRFLLDYLPLLGIALCISIFIGIVAAFASVYFVDADSPTEFPKHFGVRTPATLVSWGCAAVIPILFFNMWVFVLL